MQGGGFVREREDNICMYTLVTYLSKHNLTYFGVVSARQLSLFTIALATHKTVGSYHLYERIGAIKENATAPADIVSLLLGKRVQKSAVDAPRKWMI